MQVRVLFFGMLKDAAGRSAHTLDLPANATLADLLTRCGRDFPALPRFFDSLACSVNQNYASRQTPLHENDEVALLPPVSGGSPEADVRDQLSPAVALVRHRIASRRIADSLKRPEDGAVAVFEGIVRDNSRGRRTLYLDYEAYEEMALKQMQALVAEARQKFAIREAAIIHRLGRLEIGETSVLIAAASAHRAAAFDACRWLIDTLKKTVPIWKKEYFHDGAIWADGEAFPPEITHP